VGRYNLKSIAFTALTGGLVDSLPKERIIEHIIAESFRFLDENPINSLKDIKYCSQD